MVNYNTFNTSIEFNPDRLMRIFEDGDGSISPPPLYETPEYIDLLAVLVDPELIEEKNVNYINISTMSVSGDIFDLETGMAISSHLMDTMIPILIDVNDIHQTNVPYKFIYHPEYFKLATLKSIQLNKLMKEMWNYDM